MQMLARITSIIVHTDSEDDPTPATIFGVPQTAQTLFISSGLLGKMLTTIEDHCDVVSDRLLIQSDHLRDT
jgi:hypothetical protein